MNARQSLKLTSKRLQDVEAVLSRAQSDIKDYNACIDHMIAGGSPCDWCEDLEECQLTAKAEGKGCSEWWLKYREEDGSDEGEGIFSPGSERGGEASGPAGKIEAF